jgi:hypothetical protein
LLRRIFLTGAAAAGVTAVGAAAGAGDAAPASLVSGVDDDRAWMSGRVQEVTADGFFVQLVEPPEPAPVWVVVGPGTRMTKDGEAELGDFEPGDTIALKGDRRPGGEIEAARVNTFCHFLDDVQVSARSGHQLDTSEGRLVMRSDVRELTTFWHGGQRRPTKAASEIAAGDTIAVLGRPDPEKGTFEVHSLRTEGG